MSKPSPLVSAARSKAGKASGEARRKASKASRSSTSMPVALDEEVQQRMAAWDRQIGAPQSWNEARLRTQVEGGEYANTRMALEVRELRGRLVDREQVAKAARLTAELLTTKLKNCGKQVSDSLGQDYTVRQRAEIARSINDAIRQGVEQAQAEGAAG